MSRPMTPPAGLASGAHCLPAGAWSTRRQTTPHTRRPPPPPLQTQRHPSGAHTTHTGTAVSPSRVCHRGVRGLSAVRHALRPRQPGAPNPVESHRDGCADRGPGRPWEALTQTKPNPPQLDPSSKGEQVRTPGSLNRQTPRGAVEGHGQATREQT